METPTTGREMTHASRRWAALLLSGSLALFVPAGSLRAQAEQDEGEGSELAAQSQKPAGDLISVPFQNNTSFQIGPLDRTRLRWRCVA